MPNENDPIPLPDPPECFHRPGSTWNPDEINQARHFLIKHYYEDILVRNRVVLAKRYPWLVPKLESPDRLAEEITNHFFADQHVTDKFKKFAEAYQPPDGSTAFSKFIIGRTTVCTWGPPGQGGIAQNWLRKNGHIGNRKEQSLDEMESEDSPYHFQAVDEQLGPAEQCETKDLFETLRPWAEKNLTPLQFAVFETKKFKLSRDAAAAEINRKGFTTRDGNPITPNYLGYLWNQIRVIIRRSFNI